MPKKSFTFQKRSPDPAPPTTSPDISQFIAGHSAQMTRKTTRYHKRPFSGSRSRLPSAASQHLASGARSSTRISRRVKSNVITIMHN